MDTAVPTIVVGYDASPSSQLALDWALTTAQEDGRRVDIMHAVPIETMPHLAPATPFGWSPDTPLTPEEIEDDYLIEAMRRLPTERVRFRQMPGSPSARLVGSVGPADLVVTGSLGHGALHAALLGSTAYAVAAHAPCSVVIVRTPERASVADRPGPDHPVLVGIDDLETSVVALDAAADWAQRYGARLRIVRAVAFDALIFAGLPLFASDEKLEGSLKTQADQALAAAVDRVRATHPTLEVAASVVPGHPGIVLGHESRGAGLAVVASRGRGGFVGLPLGSVTHHLIHDAHCPVMIAR